MRLLLVLGLVLATTACGSLTHDSGKVQVAAGFYPLAWAAQQIGGHRVEVTNLTQPGAEPHDLELTIKETVAIAEADVVVYEKGFQPAVDDSVAHIQPFADQPYPTDPHFWQDPLRLADGGDALARELGRADPRHRAAYAANARALRHTLVRLDHEYADGLAHCARHTIVTTHDAFVYLGKYGLSVEPITGLSPGAEPTPADLSRLQDLIRTDGITTVFSETLVSAKTAQTLAGDLGIRSAVLDPIEGLSDRTAGQDYLSLMHHNLHALEKADGCR